jgi:hypothetical protein
LNGARLVNQLSEAVQGNQGTTGKTGRRGGGTLGADVLYASILRLRHSFLWGILVLERERSIFSALSCSLECAIFLNINTVIHNRLLTRYVAFNGVTQYFISKVPPFIPLLYIYTHVNTSTTRQLGYCIIIFFKVRSTRVGHVHRPISAAGHALLPQSTNKRPCRTLDSRGFRLCRRWISCC